VAKTLPSEASCGFDLRAEYNTVIFIALIDYCEAFDQVTLHSLWNTTDDRGFPHSAAFV
jgi:hypothetical protein